MTEIARPIATRRKFLVISTVSCANIVGAGLGRIEGFDVSVITHQHGCGQIGSDMELTQEILTGLASHPNVQYTIFAALGCETNRAVKLVEMARERGADAESVSIQAVGGVEAARRRIREILKERGSSRSELSFDDRGTMTVAVVPERSSHDRNRVYTERVVDAMDKRGIRTIVAEPVSRPSRDPSPSSLPGTVPSLWRTGPVADAAVLEDLRDRGPSPAKVKVGGSDAARLTVLSAMGAQVAVLLTGRGVAVSSPVAPTLACASDPMADDLGDAIDVPYRGPEGADAVARAVVKTAQGQRCAAELREWHDFELPRLAPFY